MDKSKYVNRNELIRYLWSIDFANWIAHNTRNSICNVIEQYEGADADVRENVRGEWQYTILDFAGEKIKSLPYCSVCKEEQQFITNFCPDCGASMRKE